MSAKGKGLLPQTRKRIRDGALAALEALAQEGGSVPPIQHPEDNSSASDRACVVRSGWSARTS